MPTIKLTQLGTEADNRVRWEVDTDEGDFSGEAANEEQATGQARTVALAYGHDDTTIDVA